MSNTHNKEKKKKREGLNTGPIFFPDIGKEAKDLLTKAYIKDDAFSISTRSHTGVVYTLTTALKHGRHSTSNIAANYAYKNGTTVGVTFDSKSHISATLGFHGKFWPSTKTTATLKLPKCSSSQLKFYYFHKNATLASSFVLNRSPEVKISGAIGNSKITFGAEAVYKIGCFFTKYDAGIHVANSNYNASIILADQGDLVKASYLLHLFDDHAMKIVVAAEITRKLSTNKNTFTVGGSCKVDEATTLKVKLNNHGKLNTLLLHKFGAKSTLSISGEFDTKALDKTPRIGLGVALML